MTDRLSEIKAREANATPPPWQCFLGAGGGGGSFPYLPERGGCVAALFDAEFVENARDDIPWLVAEVERLTNWKAEAMAVLSQWDDVFNALGKPGPLGASKADNTIAEVERLQDELDLWKPLTPEEAEKALAEAKAEPMSEEQIQRIMKKATDPATVLPNNEQAQLVAEVERLTAERDDLEAQRNEFQEAFHEIEAMAKSWQADCERLTAENARLRAFLDEILTHPAGWPISADVRLNSIRERAKQLKGEA